MVVMTYKRLFIFSHSRLTVNCFRCQQDHLNLHKTANRITNNTITPIFFFFSKYFYTLIFGQCLQTTDNKIITKKKHTNNFCTQTCSKALDSVNLTKILVQQFSTFMKQLKWKKRERTRDLKKAEHIRKYTKFQSLVLPE